MCGNFEYSASPYLALYATFRYQHARNQCSGTRVLSRFCCMWYTGVHIRELMCTFKVLDEHSCMCTVISITAHLHTWRDMLHVGTDMPGTSVQAHRFCCMWYTGVHIRELMCTLKMLDEHLGICTVISNTVHLHTWHNMLHVGTNMPGTSVTAHRFCCMWYTGVHVRELMRTFKVLDEHSGICMVISSTAHLHI